MFSKHLGENKTRDLLISFLKQQETNRANHQITYNEKIEWRNDMVSSLLWRDNSKADEKRCEEAIRIIANDLSKYDAHISILKKMLDDQAITTSEKDMLIKEANNIFADVQRRYESWGNGGVSLEYFQQVSHVCIVISEYNNIVNVKKHNC